MPVAPTIRVRFAPSPTGYLHIGGARTVLFNWLLARRHGGVFILRIEDTDQTRHVQDSVAKIMEDLRWLGLQWDEGPEVGGGCGPYFQSQRLSIYDAYLRSLLERGQAYYALESAEDLARLREDARARGEGFRYRRPDPVPTVGQGETARAAGRSVVVRFRMPDTSITVVDDILGKVTISADQLEDFVIQKSDGFPTYHFACVVDDELMGITHVLRGQEHLMNTPRHVAMQRAMGLRTPRYAHLPVIFNMDGSKMSKRDKHRAVRQAVKPAVSAGQSSVEALAECAAADRQTTTRWLDGEDAAWDMVQVRRVAERFSVRLPEIDVHDFRTAGYLPEAIVNFIALLGWSPGKEWEHFTIAELVDCFSVERVGKTNARFDRAKLVAFNTEWAGRVSQPRLLEAFKDYLAVNASPMRQADDATLTHILAAREGLRTFREVEDKTRFLYTPDDEIVYDEKAVEKVLAKGGGAGFAMLALLVPRLEGAPDWTAGAISALLESVCTERGVKMGAVAQPLRVAVTGSTISPPIHDTLTLLGRARTLTRIRRCAALAQPGS
jgi:glutamyl-tRNA synthetase